MGKLRVLNKTGDREIPWTAEDTVSLQTAEEAFFEHQKHGFAAFAKINGGHELIRSFDADAEEILVIGPLAGG